MLSSRAFQLFLAVNLGGALAQTARVYSDQRKHLPAALARLLKSIGKLGFRLSIRPGLLISSY